MEFKNKIIEIGNADISDTLKVEKTINFINDKYSYNSRPVQASRAKKLLLNNGLISEKEANNIKYSDISKDLIEKADKKLSDQEIIEISKEIFDKIVSFRSSEKPHELMIFLLLVSGRRFNEIYNGNFKIIDNKLTIDKLSKRRPDGKKDFIIDLILIKPKEFIKLHKKFKSRPLLEQNSFNRKVNRILNELNLTSHKMRSIYLYYHLNVKMTDSKKPVHMAVKNLLHHQKTESGKFYSNKLSVKGLELNYNDMTREQLKALLNKKNINSGNTKKFNKLKKSELIQLLQ